MSSTVAVLRGPRAAVGSSRTETRWSTGPARGPPLTGLALASRQRLQYGGARSEAAVTEKRFQGLRRALPSNRRFTQANSRRAFRAREQSGDVEVSASARSVNDSTYELGGILGAVDRDLSLRRDLPVVDELIPGEH